MTSSAPSQKSELAVRKAQVSDAPAIGELGARVFETTYGHAVEPDDLVVYLKETYATPTIIGELENDSNDIIVATNENGSLAGFAYLTRGSSDPCIDQVKNKVELQRLYVDIPSHGKGIGRLLIQTVEEMARQQGFKHLWLGVWENARAKAIYEKWGFRPMGSHDFNIGPSTVHTDLILTKELV